MPGRDALALALAIDWTPVVVAIITLIGVLAGIAGQLYLAKQIRTPSGKPIGAQVEDTHHVSLANNYRIQTLASALGEPGQPDTPGARKREAHDGA